MKIAVIGGGASGLICAAELAEGLKKANNESSVTIFESQNRVGKKLLSTGNGRCNMMNENIISAYFSAENFVKPTFEKFDLRSNLNFFASLGLYTKTDFEGRIYPLSETASGVLDSLRFECERLDVEIKTDFEIKKIKKSGKGYSLNDELYFDIVVIAFGSKASVKGFCGYDILKNLGLKITEIKPGLTKIILSDLSVSKSLKGIRHKATASLYYDNKEITKESGEFLFTDYGISGIASMQLSSYISHHGGDIERYKINLDLIPVFSFDELSDIIHSLKIRNPYGVCGNILSGFVPKRLGEEILKKSDVALDLCLSELKSDSVKLIVKNSKSFSLNVKGLKDFKEAQVTCGGVDRVEVNKFTLESKKFKNLFLCGEILDVDGLCGGYNLFWAFSSGRLAAESVLKMVVKND